MSDKNKEPNLWEDLDKYADELYTKKDLKAGIKIIQELVGIGVLGYSLWTIFTVSLPALGIPIASSTVLRLVARLIAIYSQRGEKDRKAIRAVFKWITGGFDLLIPD